MPTPRKPSKKIVEKIQEKFNTPDEFCYMYNAFMMGRLTNKESELEKWFLSMPEDELDEANDYYLINERLKKFSKELITVKRHCSSPEQKKLFNDLLNSFENNFKERSSYSQSFGECPEKGCVEQDNDGNWRVISNKTGEYWTQTYDSEQDAKDALAAYHINKGFNVIKSNCSTKGQMNAFNNLIKSFDYISGDNIKVGNLSGKPKINKLMDDLKNEENPIKKDIIRLKIEKAILEEEYLDKLSELNIKIGKLKNKLSK